MTLLQISVQYRDSAQNIALRIRQLQQKLGDCDDPSQRCLLQDRIHLLSTLHRETRELAVLTERYYDRGYRKNAKYTI